MIKVKYSFTTSMPDKEEIWVPNRIQPMTCDRYISIENEFKYVLCLTHLLQDEGVTKVEEEIQK